MPEIDPNGVDQHAPGAKLDDGKPFAGLMLDGFALALLEVSKVTTFGAKKYSRNGWKSVQDGEQRYHDALVRHLLISAYEELDHDSEMYHKSQVAWNALAELQLFLERKAHE